MLSPNDPPLTAPTQHRQRQATSNVLWQNDPTHVDKNKRPCGFTPHNNDSRHYQRKEPTWPNSGRRWRTTGTPHMSIPHGPTATSCPSMVPQCDIITTRPRKHQQPRTVTYCTRKSAASSKTNPSKSSPQLPTEDTPARPDQKPKSILLLPGPCDMLMIRFFIKPFVGALSKSSPKTRKHTLMKCSKRHLFPNEVL